MQFDHRNLAQGLDLTRYQPDIKSFIFDTQYLLVQLHDFTVLCSTKQCILACLLFCNNLFAAHLLRFAKSVKKQSHLCTYVTYRLYDVFPVLCNVYQILSHTASTLPHQC